MTKKIMGMALLCMVLTTQINAQYATTAYSFLGFANQTYYALTLQKEGESLKGLLTIGQEESYKVDAKIDNMNIMRIKLSSNLVTYDCNLYYDGKNIIFELDKDIINTMKWLLTLAGESKIADKVESKIVMKPV